MPIKRTTTDAEIIKTLKIEFNLYKQKIAYLFDRIGRQAVNEAKLNGKYTDQTGNLRSSIGYIVTIDGEIKSGGGFAAIKQGAEQGAEQGEQFAKKLAAEHPKGIVLIVVAGMEYASIVEDRGFNVLYTSEILAQKLAEDLLKKIQ